MLNIDLFKKEKKERREKGKTPFRLEEDSVIRDSLSLSRPLAHRPDIYKLPGETGCLGLDTILERYNTHRF